MRRTVPMSGPAPRKQNYNHTIMKRLITNPLLLALALGAAFIATPASAAPGDAAYVSNYDDDTVSVFALDTGLPLGTIPVGNGPQAVAVAPNGARAYVANALAGTVSIINTSNQTVITTLTVGQTPTSIVISPDSRNVYVANSDSASITVISAISNAVQRTIPTLSTPTALAWHPVRDELWIGFNNSGGIRVLAATNDAVLASLPGNSSRWYASTGLTFSRDGNLAYGTEGCGCCGRFHILSGNHAGGTIPVMATDLYSGGGFAMGVSVNPVNGNAYFSQAGHCTQPQRPRIAERGGLNRELLLPNQPRNTAISPDGKRMYIVLNQTVQIVDLRTFATLNTVAVGGNAQRIGLKAADPSPKLSIAVSEVTLCWPTVTETAYQLEYRTELDGSNWQSLGEPVIGTGQTNCITDAVLGRPQRLYRVRLVE